MRAHHPWGGCSRRAAEARGQRHQEAASLLGGRCGGDSRPCGLPASRLVSAARAGSCPSTEREEEPGGRPGGAAGPQGGSLFLSHPPDRGRSVGCLPRIKSFLIPRDTEQPASGGLVKH